MKIKYFFTIIPVICLIFFGGCSFSENGNTISAFTEKMNKKNESYNLQADGYIFRESDSSYCRFFTFSDTCEIMLGFYLDEKNRVTKMNAVFETGALETNSEAYDFFVDSVEVFCQNDTSAQELLSEIDFENIQSTVAAETKKARRDNITLLCDITSSGTVVTVYSEK